MRLLQELAGNGLGELGVVGHELLDAQRAHLGENLRPTSLRSISISVWVTTLRVAAGRSGRAATSSSGYSSVVAMIESSWVSIFSLISL